MAQGCKDMIPFTLSICHVMYGQITLVSGTYSCIRLSLIFSIMDSLYQYLFVYMMKQECYLWSIPGV